MTTRKELVEALRLRYRSAAFSDRIKILDEFVALTCYHRKHAIRVLRGEFSPATEVRLRNRVYDEAVAQALTVLWEAADRVCGKRLKPLIPMLVDANTKLCVFSDAQARGYTVVFIFIGISGPERSDERVEQGQAGHHGGRGAAAVVARDHRLRPQQTSSSRPLPQGQGRLRWGSPPPPEHCTSRCAPAGVASAARKRVYCERKCST